MDGKYEVKDVIQPRMPQAAVTISHIHGKGDCLFAQESLTEGQIVGYWDGVEVSHNTKYSLRLEGKIIEPHTVLRYMSHSCEPNTCFRDKGRWLYARQPIAAGDELTIDYLHTELDISHPFICNCGAAKCRGKIG